MLVLILPKKSRSGSHKKIAIALAPKKFQSTPQPLPEIFQSTLDCNFRTITPENQNFCRLYMHFAG
jgi:hypothetical protein